VPPAGKMVRAFDMSLATLRPGEPLSTKAMEFLKDNDQLLDKLDPKQLLGDRWQLWPADQEMLHVPTLPGYFTTLKHLPALSGPEVLQDAIARGVQRGLFAYALGDGEAKQFETIWFGRSDVSADQCEIIDSAWLLRPKVAKELLPAEPERVAVGGSEPTDETGGAGSGGEPGTGAGGEPWGGGGGVKIVEGERRLDRVCIQSWRLGVTRPPRAARIWARDGRPAAVGTCGATSDAEGGAVDRRGSMTAWA